MPTLTSTNRNLKAAASVSQMAKMVGLSRGRFYSLVAQGVFLPPVHSPSSKRPFYIADMQQRNLEVRQTQRGVNGEYILFYDKQQPQQGRRAQRQQQRQHSRQHDDLLRQLRSLGIDTTAAQVEQALAACFPDGVAETDDGEVLRAVNRHLRRSNDA